MQKYSAQSSAQQLCHGAPNLVLDAAALTQLLTAWVTPPAYPEALLRPRLLDRLDTALDYPLTVLTAPPGSGKTILLSQWAARLAATNAPTSWRVAWLTINPAANEPLVLARALEVALQRAGVAIEPLVVAADGVMAPEAILVHLALNGFTTPTVLILDGLEHLGRGMQAFLAHLIEHAPAQLRLVLATRSEPLLPLPRLRLQRTLFELRGADLRWNVADATALLRSGLHTDVRADDIAALVQSTEGWVTGLCLASSALQGAAGRFDEFNGADRAVVDYIASEVLTTQPQIVQAFLLRSAALPELTIRGSERLLRSGPPDTEALGLNSAPAMLDYLERNNLFVEALDRQRTRYRYHPLIAEALTVLRAIHLPETPNGAGSVGVPLDVQFPALPAEATTAPDETWLIAEGLSEREQEILRLAAGGLPNREIAQQLWISEATVKSHLKRIFGKLGARNRTEAVAIARRKQLMSVV